MQQKKSYYNLLSSFISLAFTTAERIMADSWLLGVTSSLSEKFITGVTLASNRLPATRLAARANSSNLVPLCQKSFSQCFLCAGTNVPGQIVPAR